MKLQFSLATLLICMTVLAVVYALAMNSPVYVYTHVDRWEGIGAEPPVMVLAHSPTPVEVAWRMALWGPTVIAAALATLWAIRRLKSRRENGPSGG